ncbi:DUF2087 domain-containing protein [Serinicoccus kebangsaanensis]|uniref:DUF2087 domain-containing protein n=1 Tax=Serinicoccus kebangsaanensis TaxID=2602069 RepID=UPI00124E7813|nr:DUF2087 domain-containing protein [Serinicoccus kebangsaanensis]
MTTDADLKARVRERMARTGENYTAARAALLTEPPRRALVVETDLVADKAVRSFFDGDRLRSIPTRRRARAAVLMELLTRFERGREYAEREVNEILATAHEDVASLRRELVDYRWVRRADGIYRVVDEVPERHAQEAQEVPSDEVARLARVPRARHTPG